MGELHVSSVFSMLVGLQSCSRVAGVIAAHPLAKVCQSAENRHDIAVPNIHFARRAAHVGVLWL